MNDDTTKLRIVALTPSHIEAFRDLSDRVEAARRHVEAWDARPVGGDNEAESAATAHLAHAIGSLERLSSAADALRSELSASQAKRTEVKHAKIDSFFGAAGEVHDVIESRKDGA